MVGSISAQVGLLAFALAIVAGVAAGNASVTVLTRALVVMGAAVVVSKLAAWTHKMVLEDHIRAKKRELEEAHVAAHRRHEELKKAETQAGNQTQESNAVEVG